MPIDRSINWGPVLSLYFIYPIQAILSVFLVGSYISQNICTHRSARISMNLAVHQSIVLFVYSNWLSRVSVSPTKSCFGQKEAIYSVTYRKMHLFSCHTKKSILFQSYPQKIGIVSVYPQKGVSLWRAEKAWGYPHRILNIKVSKTYCTIGSYHWTHSVVVKHI